MDKTVIGRVEEKEILDKALGISGIYTRSASFFKKGDKQNQGTQIDLID